MKYRYQVGDVVTIKSHYDLNCKAEDYPSTFTNSMLRVYGGHRFKISSVEEYTIEQLNAAKSLKQYNGDNHLYFLEGIGYIWTSSMFKRQNLLINWILKFIEMLHTFMIKILC